MQDTLFPTPLCIKYLDHDNKYYCILHGEGYDANNQISHKAIIIHQTINVAATSYVQSPVMISG